MAVNDRLSGKVAVITGASSGLGAASAKLFAREGAKVVVAARRGDLLAKVTAAIRADGGLVIAVPTDVSKDDEVAALMKRADEAFGPINVLFNNAGVQLLTSIEDTTVEAWDQVLAINLRAVWLCTKHALPYMRRAGGGSIINTSSNYAFGAVSHQSAYTASKGGIVALTRQLALELVKENIRVNCLAPAWMDTEYARNWFDKQADPKAAWDATVAAYPIGRPAAPEEIAKGALFLASDESSYMVGDTLIMDGGYLAQ